MGRIYFNNSSVFCCHNTQHIQYSIGLATLDILRVNYVGCCLFVWGI